MNKRMCPEPFQGEWIIVDSGMRLHNNRVLITFKTRQEASDYILRLNDKGMPPGTNFINPRTGEIT